MAPKRPYQALGADASFDRLHPDGHPPPKSPLRQHVASLNTRLFAFVDLNHCATPLSEQTKIHIGCFELLLLYLYKTLRSAIALLGLLSLPLSLKWSMLPRTSRLLDVICCFRFAHPSNTFGIDKQRSSLEPSFPIEIMIWDSLFDDASIDIRIRHPTEEERFVVTQYSVHATMCTLCSSQKKRRTLRCREGRQKAHSMAHFFIVGGNRLLSRSELQRGKAVEPGFEPCTTDQIIDILKALDAEVGNGGGVGGCLGGFVPPALTEDFVPPWKALDQESDMNLAEQVPRHMRDVQPACHPVHRLAAAQPPIDMAMPREVRHRRNHLRSRSRGAGRALVSQLVYQKPVDMLDRRRERTTNSSELSINLLFSRNFRLSLGSLEMRSVLLMLGQSLTSVNRPDQQLKLNGYLKTSLTLLSSKQHQLVSIESWKMAGVSTLAECNISSPVLENLPPETPVHKYESIEQMRHVCQQRKEDVVSDKTSYVVFTSCDTEILPARQVQTLHCFSDIDFEKSVAVVKIPTSFTKRLSVSVAATFREAERIAGFDGSFSHFTLSHIRTTRRLKENIARWHPNLDNRRPDGRTWPTLAVEYYLTERPPNLKDDVRFWLEESHGETSMVLTAAFNVRMKVAMLRCWTRQRKEGTNEFEIASLQQCRVVVAEPDDEVGSHFGHLLTFNFPVIKRLWDVSWVDQAEIVLAKSAMVRMVCFAFGTEYPSVMGHFAIE
ncbi:hypothetical protein KEM54_006075 [Ascosphaera aggregata]|nr:hypothetical protein KEM54_006075 [Ascosphaera aggregata]